MNPPSIHDIRRRYGDVVREGPSTVSFGEREPIKDIYVPGNAWNKACAR